LAFALSAALAVAGCGGTTTSPTLETAAATLASVAPATAAPPSVPPTPALTGLTGRIVFTRAGGSYGDETVYLASIDGSGEQRLTDFGKSGGPTPVLHGTKVVIGGAAPDGRFAPVIVDLGDLSRTVVPLPAGDLNLPGGPMTPDGRFMVSEGFNDAHPDEHAVYRLAVDGSSLKRLTTKVFLVGDISQDGRQVVLFQGPDGSPPPPGALWVMNIDGSSLRRLTPDGVAVQCCFNYRWSPDGSKIVFASQDGGLWTIAPNGTGLTEVYTPAAETWAITPTWSPDGSMILFALDPSSDPFQHPANGLYVIRADGTGLTLVLGGSDFKREPVWVEG